MLTVFLTPCVCGSALTRQPGCSRGAWTLVARSPHWPGAPFSSRDLTLGLAGTHTLTHTHAQSKLNIGHLAYACTSGHAVSKNTRIKRRTFIPVRAVAAAAVQRRQKSNPAVRTRRRCRSSSPSCPTHPTLKARACEPRRSVAEAAPPVPHLPSSCHHLAIILPSSIVLISVVLMHDHRRLAPGLPRGPGLGLGAFGSICVLSYAALSACMAGRAIGWSDLSGCSASASLR